MKTLNVSELKKHCDSIIDQVARTGEAILIEKSEKPVAKIIPYKSTLQARRLGRLKGKIQLSKDWNEWPPDLALRFGMQNTSGKNKKAPPKRGPGPLSRNSRLRDRRS